MRFLSLTVAVLLLVACTPGGEQSPPPEASGHVGPTPSITAASIPSPAPTPTPTPTPTTSIGVPSAPASFPADLLKTDAESAPSSRGGLRIGACLRSSVRTRH